MKIGIQKDTSLELDIKKCTQLLNALCKAHQFCVVPTRDQHLMKPINYERESKRISTLCESMDLDFIFYVTAREYEDNYFYYSSSTDLVLSLANWQHYTTLPEENGLFFFIAQNIADNIFNRLNHDEPTGCLSDFLWSKSGVDKCMKLGHLWT